MKARLIAASAVSAIIIFAGANTAGAAEDGEESTSRWEQLKNLYDEKIGSSEQSDADDGDLSGKIEAIKAYYRESRESTAEMSKEAYQWLQDDIAKIGAWEYHVFTADNIEDDGTRETLTQMGLDRWELVSAVASEGHIVFVLKRAMKSYVKILPAQDVLKLMGDASPEVKE